jgi:hypothetical protein
MVAHVASLLLKSSKLLLLKPIKLLLLRKPIKLLLLKLFKLLLYPPSVLLNPLLKPDTLSDPF